MSEAYTELNTSFSSHQEAVQAFLSLIQVDAQPQVTHTAMMPERHIEIAPQGAKVPVLTEVQRRLALGGSSLKFPDRLLPQDKRLIQSSEPGEHPSENNSRTITLITTGLTPPSAVRAWEALENEATKIDRITISTRPSQKLGIMEYVIMAGDEEIVIPFTKYFSESSQKNKPFSAIEIAHLLSKLPETHHLFNNRNPDHISVVIGARSSLNRDLFPIQGGLSHSLRSGSMTMVGYNPGDYSFYELENI